MLKFMKNNLTLSCVMVLILQACAAYSFITIPSLTNVFQRLHLYLVSGQVALVNQCHSQGQIINSVMSLLIYS